MNAVPRLSIGLPVYNGEKYLGEALDSLLGQTYEDFELLISDNASTDSTAEICRRYGKQDSRIRHIVQPRNIGLVANHNFLIGQASGELFKWASHDDLYAPELLRRCVDALDEYPHVVLAHSRTAMFDSAGIVNHLFDYRVAVDAVRAPERFRSMLFDGWDDYTYGVIRTDVLRRTSLLGSHHFSDRTIIVELGLHGPFCLIPDLLHFRREHADRPPWATVRHRCATMDPRRANRLRHPVARLYAEYLWAYVAAVRHAPLSPADRRECYRTLERWAVGRALPVASRTLPGRDRGVLFQFPESSQAGPQAGPAAASLQQAGLQAGPTAASVQDVVSGLAAPVPDVVSGPSAAALRIGLFGGLGSGNIGNDASMEAILGYLQVEHPDAIVDAMATGPGPLTDRYGIEAVPLLWYDKYEQRASGVTAITLKIMSRGIDAFRTASWVRRHDVVIVPGMGVLEASLPLRPWQLPYHLFVLCLSGRVFGTKVALVSVGARAVNQRLTRWLFRSAARLAFYRSYRDIGSRDAMRRQGRRTAPGHAPDRVYPDLVFALPMPAYCPGDAKTVGVGVMAYRGTNDDDRGQAEQIHRSYLAKMTYFTGWLVDHGYQVRLLIGDANGSDDRVVEEIVAGLRATRPDLDPAQAVAEPVSTFADLTRAMAPAGTVVATRYHNIVCALRLSRPTISIGYAAKNTALMTDMGLIEYCQHVNSLDVSRLIEQFDRLQRDSAELRQKLLARNAVNEQLAQDQFDELSAVLFPAPKS